MLPASNLLCHGVAGITRLTSERAALFTITIAAAISLIGALAAYAKERSLEEVLAENGRLRYQIAHTEQQIWLAAVP